MQKVLSVTDNLIGTHALALHTDNRGSLIVIQSGNLHGKRKAGGWFGIFFFKRNTPEGCVSTKSLSVSSGFLRNSVCFIKDDWRCGWERLSTW